MRYICSICGYVYDEAGNSPFGDLPEDWKCPLCGASKADFVPEGATLDFQGSIINPDQDITVQININKPVNVISSTKDAYVDLNTTAGSLLGDSPGNSFAVTRGGSGSNISGIYFHNTQLWFSNTHNVILDNISNIVEDQKVGSGVGACVGGSVAFTVVV